MSKSLGKKRERIIKSKKLILWLQMKSLKN